MKRKQYFVLIILCILVFISGLHERFIGSGIRYDIYYFYDYPNGRFLSNIVKDFSQLITVTSLLFMIYFISPTRNYKKIFLPFLIISCADIVDYVLFFQKFAHVKLAALLILFAIYIYPLILKKKT